MFWKMTKRQIMANKLVFLDFVVGFCCAFYIVDREIYCMELYNYILYETSFPFLTDFDYHTPKP